MESAPRNPRSRVSGRLVLLAALAVALGAGPPATATVDVVPANDLTGIAVTARNQSGPDGDHRFSVSFTAFPGGGTGFSGRFGEPAIETAGGTCPRDLLGNDVRCPFLPSVVTLDLGDGADEIAVGALGTQCVAGDPAGPDRRRVSIEGALGDGRDAFSLFSGGLLQDGDCPVGARTEAPRLDVVRIDGGAGPDTFRGMGGADGTPRIVTWSGGTGSDTFIDGVGPEIFVGGPNRDTVSYARRTDGLLLSPGQTPFGDGPDGDDIRGDVEVVIGGRGADQFFGGDGPNEFLGGAGADRYQAGGGDDLVIDVDGEADTVDCGAGNDQARLDLRDVVVASRVAFLGRLLPGAPSCEDVIRSAVDDGPPARITTRTLRLAAPSVRLACPRAARVRCRGTLVLRDPGRPVTRLAAQGYDVAVGGARSVALALTDRGRRTLRTRGVVVAATTERGTSALGPRSARRLLRVAG